MRDSEAQFRELADTTPALMWMTDAEGDVTFVNQGWLRFTGGTPGAGDRRFAAQRPSGRPRGAAPAVERGLEPREEFRCEYRLRHAASDGYRWVLEVGTPRFSGGEFVGYVGHRHGHPRAAHDGGGAARVRGELPRAGRHRPGHDVDDRHGRPDHVREPGLAALHRHDLPGGDGRELGCSACTPTTPRTCCRAGRRRSRAAPPVGARVPPPHHSGEYRWIDDRGVPRYVGEPLRRPRGHGDRHPRAQDDGVAPARGLPARAPDRRDAPAQPAARAAAADRRARDGGALPAGRARRRHRRATGTTCSSGPTGAWRSWWATSPATASAPRHRWASSATRSAPTGWSRLAGRGGGAHQPARHERRGAGDGHGALPRARPRDRARWRSAPPAIRRRS